VNCPSCGVENRVDARFCDSCGTAPRGAGRGAAQARHASLLRRLGFDRGGRASRRGGRPWADVPLLPPDAGRDRGHGGTVEKFVGDAVLAVFGVPVANEDDAARAVRAALEMRARMEELNAEISGRFGSTLQLRIGLNTGEVVAGDASPGRSGPSSAARGSSLGFARSSTELRVAGHGPLGPRGSARRRRSQEGCGSGIRGRDPLLRAEGHRRPWSPGCAPGSRRSERRRLP